MSLPTTTITSLHLPITEHKKLQQFAKERMRSQSHLLRTALAYWWANGAPEVPADFAPQDESKVRSNFGKLAEFP